MSKKYTFEDWLEGRIDNNEASNLKLQYALHGEKQDFIPEEESKKISDYKKETFRKAVEITASTYINDARKKLAEDTLKNPKRWLTLEIEKVEKFISGNPKLEQKYEENAYDSGSIRATEAKRINGMYRKFKKRDHYRGYAGSSLATMYAKKEYLSELKKLQNSENGTNPRLKYHSENYFDTALEIYRNSKKDNQKGLTWPEVYEKIVAEENKLGMENRYSTFDSFDTRRKKYQREQRSPN